MKSTFVVFTLLSIATTVEVWLLQGAIDATPAFDGMVTTRWPNESLLPRPNETATLVVFVHPRCPCTRATLHELANVLERSDATVAVQVLFSRPDPALGELWPTTETWNQAGRLPGAIAQWDDNGREAACFGARASGHVMLFDRAGLLRFDGGITASRGQEGKNGFCDALGGMLQGRSGPRRTAPVFGCALVLPNQGG